MKPESRHGKHKDPDKHRTDMLAHYHAHKHEPEYRARRKAARRRYYLRSYKRADCPGMLVKLHREAA